ncbi:hypothetical protein QYF36_000133 [Acer negundo]|nr:hypothetical protein QYF36_000133 [Acer negundo]
MKLWFMIFFRIWVAAGLWRQISSTLHHHLRSVFEHVRENLYSKGFDFFGIVVWSIWGQRNFFIHDGNFRDPPYVFTLTKKMLDMSFAIFKINFFLLLRKRLLWVEGSPSIGVGAIVRDNFGVVQVSFASDVGELFAVREAVQCAYSAGALKVPLHLISDDLQLASNESYSEF